MIMVTRAHFLESRKFVSGSNEDGASAEQGDNLQHSGGHVPVRWAVLSYFALSGWFQGEYHQHCYVFIPSTSLRLLLFSNSPQHTEDKNVSPITYLVHATKSTKK